jgi:nitrogen fixation protein NifB
LKGQEILHSISHPCFSHEAHFKIGRIHLPVALKCNIGCNFCDRKVSSFYHTSRPGLTSRILEPEECVEVVEAAIGKNPNIEVIGISGPGEPLYNDETFRTLDIVSREFSAMKLCVCTNGLLLPEKVINTVEPVIGAKINSHVIKNGKIFKGIEGARFLIENQLKGLEMAVEQGMVVKVNTVLIPGINMDHVRDIAEEIALRGAFIMNIMPLIPLGGFKDLREPTCEELIHAREQCEPTIPIFRMCKQCRADACGVPGIDEK